MSRSASRARANWRDVRRRAVKKRLPAALAVVAIVAILVAGPAFALRHQIVDLWESAEPDKNLYVRAFADCGQGPFTLEFHPVRGAVVRQDGDTLARASFTDRQIECDATIHAVKGTPDENRGPDWQPRGPSYKATTITCQTDAALQVSVNPIWDEHGTIGGSAISVRERATRKPIAAAALKKPDPTAYPGTSRVSWSDVCRSS